MVWAEVFIAVTRPRTTQAAVVEGLQTAIGYCLCAADSRGAAWLASAPNIDPICIKACMRLTSRDGKGVLYTSHVIRGAIEGRWRREALADPAAHHQNRTHNICSCE